MERSPTPTLATSEPATLDRRREKRFATRVALAALLGLCLGVVFGKSPILFGFGNEDLGKLSLLVVRLLKALAGPLVGLAILNGLLQALPSGRSVLRLVTICAINTSVAMAIGLSILNGLEPGKSWQGHLDQLSTEIPESGLEKLKAGAAGQSINPLEILQQHVPKSVVEPFANSDVLGIVLLSVLAAVALRGVRSLTLEGGEPVDTTILERGVAGCYAVTAQMLHLVVQLVPLIVLGAVASSVGRFGVDVFRALSLFLGVILGGMAIHALLYYPLVAWLVGGVTPRRYLVTGGGQAVLTGLSTNSSLATVPVTLRCLTEKLGISFRSANLAACVGTNLNNDGITLYEAMAALFLSQAAGFSLGLGQQLQVVVASILAGIGVAGIPEAGLIMLPLVLGAAGLSEEAIAHWLPIILGVDWIIARARSGVNVLSDMLVAILLDVGEPEEAAEP